MDLHASSSAKPAVAQAVGEPSTAKESSNGFVAWWRPRRSNTLDTSHSSSTSTSIMSTNSPPKRQHRKGEERDSPSSANRLLFAWNETQPQQQQRQQDQPGDPDLRRGTSIRRGAGATPPEEDINKSSNNSSTVRRRRPDDEQGVLGSSSGKLKSLKLAPVATFAAVAGSSSPGTPATSSGSDGGDSTWTSSLGRAKGRRREQDQQQQQLEELERRRHRDSGASSVRTPSKPPRPHQARAGAGGTNGTRSAADSGDKGGKDEEEKDKSGGSSTAGARTAVVGGHEEETEMMMTPEALAAEADGMACCDGAEQEEGMDDETAVEVNAAKEPSVVYDILAVDRGCGFCDTSVVPFQVEEGGAVETERMRGLTSGQSEFLARRGFAAGLVSHFLEETNCEFRVLQGGASCGMNAQQLEEAAVRLEEAFVPAVKRLRGRSSMDVVLDSLFEGADDAGEFVVRFEVSITRCHPEDIESSPAPALRECARAIREAVREEGVAEQSTHEVVFVGRPMWELVSPVLDFSAKVRAVEEKAA